MRLISLRIVKGLDGSPIREVRFNKEGPSLIVDLDSVEGKSGNNIGKSTFAKLIDICLGARSVKSIYYDSETKEDSPLKNFLMENKVYAELAVEMQEGKLHFLRRDLWEDGKSHLDAEEVGNIVRYQKRLKELIFPDAPDSITFRSIIPFFIRLGNNAGELFRYNGPYVKAPQLRMFYEYLMGLKISPDSYSLLTERDSLESQNKTILAKRHIKDIGEIDSLIENRQKELDAFVASLRSSERVRDFVDDRNNEELISTMRELEEKKYDLNLQIEVFRKKIADDARALGQIDQSALRLLFDDGKTFIVDLRHSFSDFIKFHEDMVRKRIERFRRRIDSLQKDSEEVEKKLSDIRSTFSSRYIDYKYKIDARANGGLDEFLEKSAELKTFQSDKVRYEKNGEKLREIFGRLKSIGEAKELNQEKRDLLVRCFASLTERIIGKKIALSFKEEGMPLQCDAGKMGDGRKKALVSCLVFSFIRLNNDSGREFPQFLVQDAMEQVSGPDFSGLAEASVDNHCQYIIPMLKDKIPEEKTYEDKVVLTLSQKDKLFRF